MSDQEKIEFRWGERIVLRDGIVLHATAYLPREQSAPHPAIVTTTPYVADSFHDRGVYFAARGFPFVIVDVRGRGNSEGKFEPSINERQDGHDIVEWVACQPWCDGQVAMWGGSYGGYTQWAAASTRPPHLKTIVPVASPCRGVDAPMRSNIFFPERAQWFTFTSGRTAQTQLYNDGAFWSAVYKRWHQSGRSFRELDKVLGNPCAPFQQWLDHPEPDSYWDAQNPSSADYAALTIPILSITGIYDDDQPGALAHYRRHLANCADGSQGLHYLVIGPWDHAGTRTPLRKFAGLSVGDAALVDLPQLHIDWYRWTMLGGPKPPFLVKPVAYYVMGAEIWRYSNSLEEVTAHSRPLYLDSAANAVSVFASGSLGDELGSGATDQYHYDPRDVNGPEIENEGRIELSSLTDQSLTFALNGRQLVYHSEPLTEDLEIAGFFELTAWIAIDCPDTDFYVAIYEIDRDGHAVRLTTDAMRARYREGLRSPKLIDTDEPLPYRFSGFTFCARRLKRGSRLRLTIAPTGRLGESTFPQRNFNAGGVVADESIADARAVTVKLFHDADHPSVLKLPIGAEAGVE